MFMYYSDCMYYKDILTNERVLMLTGSRPRPAKGKFTVRLRQIYIPFIANLFSV
jgi:hypothetical protein